MRFWIVFVTVCSLLLLPFSGNSTMLPDVHAMDQKVSLTESTATNSDDAHCELMAARMAEVRQLRSEHHAPSAKDCCDDMSDCLTDCSTDCGHCVISGHGCSAAAAALQLNNPVVMHDAAVTPLSLYSFTLAQASPPPIIA
ncbi:hypothetical protein FM042_07785 [Aliidiomarina halalkaliphila]|uniref:Uncharacterized protein n=1 Tax=Aliidiomarina halalkaliphila TaxID=2593535 RepID=A0A552X1H8_9GAMM|nr:hypothetical protein [Aliidiomarina halalkaliphila]TRW48874.1 hypothetical protein FM042_07785 [Aliidiomarina halalkaliphila]